MAEWRNVLVFVIGPSAYMISVQGILHKLARGIFFATKKLKRATPDLGRRGRIKGLTPHNSPQT